MLIDFLLLLFIAVGFLVVGFAQQQEPIVKVPLSKSVRVGQTMYHPNSKGREMPLSDALSLGFDESDFIDYEPEPEPEPEEEEPETVETEPEKSKEDDKAGEAEQEDESEEAETSQEESDQEEESESQVKEAVAIPEDTPMYDKLKDDDRFSTVEALIKNREELTSINGIGKKTAKSIVEHVSN